MYNDYNYNNYVHNNFNGIEPSSLKKLWFKDVLKYAKNLKIKITKELLLKNNFKELEAVWLLKNNLEDIKMYHEKIEADLTNKKIKELNEKIKKIKLKNKSLLNKIYTMKENSNNNIFKKKETKLNVKKISEDIWKVEEDREKIKNGKIKKYKISILIKDNDVNILLDIIRTLTSKNYPKLKYQEIAAVLLIKHRLNIGLDAFNGGKNRHLYWKKYYYPIKILEKNNYISYSKKGVITYLKYNN